MSLKESNNKRFKELNENQKKELKNKLILWRVGSFVALNVIAFFTIGIAFGLLGWLLIMILLLDKYLVKWGLDSLEKR